MQLLMDFRKCLKYVEIYSLRPEMLLSEEDERDKFCSFDPSLIRAERCSVCIPPAGYRLEPQQADGAGVRLGQFTCNRLRCDGTLCTKTFDSFAKREFW